MQIQTTTLNRQESAQRNLGEIMVMPFQGLKAVFTASPIALALSCIGFATAETANQWGNIKKAYRQDDITLTNKYASIALSGLCILAAWTAATVSMVSNLIISCSYKTILFPVYAISLIIRTCSMLMNAVNQLYIVRNDKKARLMSGAKLTLNALTVIGSFMLFFELPLLMGLIGNPIVLGMGFMVFTLIMTQKIQNARQEDKSFAKIETMEDSFQTDHLKSLDNSHMNILKDLGGRASTKVEQVKIKPKRLVSSEISNSDFFKRNKASSEPKIDIIDSDIRPAFA